MQPRTDLVARGQPRTIGSRLRTQKGHDARHSPRTGLRAQRWTKLKWRRNPFADPPLPLGLAGKTLFLCQPSRFSGQGRLAIP